MTDPTTVSLDSSDFPAAAGHPTLLADVYPAGRSPSERQDGGRTQDLRTAVLMLHGGAWRLGDRTMMSLRCQELSRRGFVCIAAEYRLLGEAPWPAQIDDVRSWIRWIRANAGTLGIDRGRVAVEGCSAGAHLALLAAGTATPDSATPDSATPGSDVEGDCSVDAVVALYPPTELSAESASRLLGPTASTADIRAASPLTHVSRSFPPTLFAHGLADTMVPPSSSQDMYEALQAEGVPTEIHLFEGQMHEFDAAPTYAALLQHLAAVFLERTLVDPARFAHEQASHNPLASGSR